MVKRHSKKDLREIDYGKGKRDFGAGKLSRGKLKTVDGKKTGRGVIHRVKRILDSSGTLREVEFGKWEQEIQRNPNGPTAERARLNKDPDLKNLKIKKIPVGGWHEKSGSGEPKVPISRRDSTVNRDMSGMAKDLQKRPGFRSAETGKPGNKREKKKVGKDGAKP